MQNTTSLSLCARLTIDMHSLNNEGTEGNQQQTRMVHIIDQNGSRAVVNAISGDMFKHILVGHLVPLLQDAGEPLCEPAKRLDPDRITADERFVKTAKAHKERKGPPAELLDTMLKSCSLTDLAGTLFVDSALPRKSCVEFGWVVGLPTDSSGAPLTTTEQYFHVKYAADRGAASGTDSTVGKQAIFHRPASSGIYALVCNLDISRVGLNDITREYAINAESRRARTTALVMALAAALLKPAGAHRNTQNPHIVACEGVIATSNNSLPSPTISPLQNNYVDEMKEIAGILNNIKPNSIDVSTFSSMPEAIRVLTSLAAPMAPVGV